MKKQSGYNKTFRISIFAFFVALQLFLISCANTITEQPGIIKSDFYKKLEQVWDITSITEITQDEQLIAKQNGKLFKEKYLVTIRQPLSWDNLLLGNFEQRVEIGYMGEDKPTVFTCNGYYLEDRVFSYEGSMNDFVKILDANYISVEYRFFKDSIPAGFENDKTKYYEFMTSKNASHDLHHIRENFKNVFPKNWLSTGASKGGYTTETYAMYWPDDCKVYVPCVAPLCKNRADERFSDFVYNRAGDSLFSNARDLRKILLEIISEVLLNEEEVAKCLLEAYDYPDYSLDEAIMILETYLSDYPTGVWMYQINSVAPNSTPKYFDEIQRNVLNKKVGKTSRNYHKYCKNLLKAITLNDVSLDLTQKNILRQYYYQSWTEMGNYKLSIALVEQKLAENGFAGRFKIAEDKADLFYDNFSDFQKKEFKNLPASGITTMRNSLIEWRKTSKQNVIFVYGACDPWTAVSFYANTYEAPLNPNNPNMFDYVNPNCGHSASIFNSCNQAENAKWTNLVISWMNEY